MTLADRLEAALTRASVTRESRVVGDDVPWPEAFKPAAVLVAITDQPSPSLILTLRAGHMRDHAGQIAFPGGRIDPTDRDAAGAALREAQEEIALDPALVTVIGTNDAYRTGSGYCITPVISVVPANLRLMPNHHEVAEIFEVPLDFVLDPANQRRKSGLWRGHIREYYEIQWQHRRIWGATAGMLVNLTQRLT